MLGSTFVALICLCAVPVILLRSIIRRFQPQQVARGPVKRCSRHIHLSAFPFVEGPSLSHNIDRSEFVHVPGISTTLAMSPWDMRTASPMGMHWEAVMPQETFSVPSSIHSAQPQPQCHAMLPPASQQEKLRKYSREDWNDQRLEITRLYENGTLESVMKFMREQYRLDAT